jgi:hypothetical protein
MLENSNVWLYSPAEPTKTNFLFSQFLIFWVERRQTTESQNTIPAAFARLQEHLLVKPQTPAIKSVLIQIWSTWQSHSIINMKTEKPWKHCSRFKMSRESPNIFCQDQAWTPEWFLHPQARKMQCWISALACHNSMQNKVQTTNHSWNSKHD